MTLSAHAICTWGEIVSRASSPWELERQEALLTRELVRADEATQGMLRMLAEIRAKRLAAEKAGLK